MIGPRPFALASLCLSGGMALSCGDANDIPPGCEDLGLSHARIRMALNSNLRCSSKPT